MNVLLVGANTLTLRSMLIAARYTNKHVNLLRKYYPRNDNVPISVNVASSLSNNGLLTSDDLQTEARDIDRSNPFAILLFDQRNATNILPPQPIHDELSDEDLTLKFSKGITFAPPESVAVLWSDERQTAFETVRSPLSSDTILVIPDMDAPFVVRTDASDYGVSAVLLQPRDDVLMSCRYAS
ncbi:reverse transcriptase/ribonuclease h [Plakobranchus ocellatus]|uniref:Reverse transcriptase/ribonuclease h n=1 Tax=Plakobranchus ocellatus TaxID=259542 RepID=A0AAV4CBB0_9GAST|nr:reverse transcriptase/ribonuclease h [Plakobranchus ocellatus]